MAEGGNGQFEIRVAGQSLGVTSRDLISVLLILVAGLGGYFIATQLTSNQRQGLLGQQHVAEQLAAYQVTTTALVQNITTLRDTIQDHERTMERLMEQVHQQLKSLSERLGETP